MPKKIEARRSAIHGNGVFATQAIAKGERVVRYKGKLRTHEEVDGEYGEQPETGHTFLFTLNDKYVIDANIDGNAARWINHSCDPNCEAVFEESDTGKKRKDRIYIEAMRDIAAGEELTYNYGIVLSEPHTAANKKLWACRCGSPKCTGTMLQPKKSKKKA
ncbi:MAG: SET domain-containing protein-lysine N-methyltransferase [Arenimonas sp. SCN 70-307]|mgnify:CR=1 FL=1|uniref:SET domain-containing protein n=1 Tax=Arenimonas sp. SCN 70-307 TaxID=1660089 RepID=UPI00086E1D6F|nr:SET domain-containing protein [Arenimonas sp. SCN 70-307]ODS61893.1 MAG: SET domain-containing protein-lysine N-methyltransferase [Arenimonas sp. SCN 70-307]